MPDLGDKTISIIGLGYIGLPTAALLASKGYKVLGMDVSRHVVDTINLGKVHIVEPELGDYVRTAVSQGRLEAYTEVKPADIYILCVPTPFNSDNGLRIPNIDYVKEATLSISPHIKAGDIIILESTSPVGTTDLLRSILRNQGVDVDEIYIAYCPERVLPGKIMAELVHNDRVIGGVDIRSTNIIARFYRTFVSGEILQTEARTAEMCKLTENSFRDVNIAFANELSMLCNNNEVNVWELIRLANHHPRVNILQPGPGVGGHCIAVDPWFIVSEDPDNAKLIQKAREVNNVKPRWVADRIIERAEESGKDRPKIVCLGLAFKADIDDLRGSPAIEVIETLIAAKYDVVCVEPNVTAHPRYVTASFEDALADADVVAILVGHKQFRSRANMELLLSAKAMDFCGIIS